MHRRTLLASAGMLAGVWRFATASAETPGVTATEIRIGNTMPYSGPASTYSVMGRLETAFFKMVNEHGGVAGRTIEFISLDDGYSPPKTVEQVRRLVEQDQVVFMFNSLGTPTNSAVQKYLNDRKVPHLFITSGADKFGNYKQFPWTMGWIPSFRTEAQVYTKHVLGTKPDAQIGILYQTFSLSCCSPLKRHALPS